VTDLGSRIVAVVQQQPGITTKRIALAVRTRKADVLAELHELTSRALRFEKGPRGSRRWYALEAVPELFPTCSRGISAPERDPAEESRS
jgi:hypothetical protein